MPSEQPSSLLGPPEAEAVTGSGPRAWATLRPISQFPVSAGTIYGYQAVAILEVKHACHSPELSNSSTQRSDRVMLYKQDSTIWTPATLSLAARVPYLKEEELAPQHHADGPEMYCRLLGELSFTLCNVQLVTVPVSCDNVTTPNASRHLLPNDSWGGESRLP